MWNGYVVETECLMAFATVEVGMLVIVLGVVDAEVTDFKFNASAAIVNLMHKMVIGK